MTYYSHQIHTMSEELYPRNDLRKRIINAKQFMDRHYMEDMDLRAVCEKACLSKYHFIRIFKMLYGRTPHRYLTEVRVAKARGLIRAGNTVRGACFAVGYDSVTSFSLLFKKIVGLAPSRIEQESNFR